VRLLGSEETAQPGLEVRRQLLGLAGRLQHRPGRERLDGPNGLLVVLTLITINIALAVLQRWWPPLGKVFNGVPMVIVEEGRPLRELMERARVEEEDVLEAARRLQGLERMDQIKYAILEKSGGISVIPKK
jgi:uncharacterized membrane protein YcaP (DUF421 family)